MRLSYEIIDSRYGSLKELLKQEFLVSERFLLKLKHEKAIFINREVAPIRSPIHLGDIVEILWDKEEESENIVKSNLPLSILYEDSSFLILNKPQGMPVHPSFSHYEDSLCNGVKYYFDHIHLQKKIRPINRLDKDTSGIVIFAKNEYIQECLIRQMKTREFKKEYIAVIEGSLEEKEGTIAFPIKRKNSSIIERCVAKDGEMAITHYDVIYSNGSSSVLHILLETGRTHQIRVHFSYLGHPLMGDTLYGNSSLLITRQALHASIVSFIHPITKEIMEITAPIPKDMEKLISEIKNNTY